MGRKILRMHKDFCVYLFQAGEQHYRVIDQGLPADTRIVAVSMDVFFDRDCVAFKLESNVWPDIEPGTQLEIIEPKMERIHSGARREFP
jgi:hypothetical protein